MPIWQRYTRIVGSFLITAACYTAYAAGLAPLLEPPIKWVEPSDIPDGAGSIAKLAGERRMAYLGQWFSADDWELQAPKTLETPQGTLLFDDYQPRDGGLIEITPCTMIFNSTSPEDADPDPDQARRAIILRAPRGALLRFDSPIDLKQAAIGKLIGGELLGEVTIRSDQRDPGPEDDLLISTHNVALNQTEITTPELMEFRLGPHYGRGRGVQIMLAPEGSKGDAATFNVRELNLLEQVFMHIEPSAGGDLFPGSGTAKSKHAATAAPAKKGEGAPVEVRSTGRFTFDFVDNFALFRKQVDVVRLHNDGSLDQMTGEQLKIVFDETAPTSAPDPNAKKAGKKIEPRRIEFTGEPVVIRAPANDMQARAQYVEHDLQTRSVRLRDAVEVVLRQQDRELHCPEIFYLPGAPGSNGTFQAVGRGMLSGSAPDDPRQTFAAEWTTRLHFRPHEDRQVLSLHGAAKFESSGKGALAGDEIHLWLVERPDPAAPPPQPGEKPKMELVPDRLLALNQVHIQSPQLVGAASRLEGWFEQEAAAAMVHRVHFAPQEDRFAPVGGAPRPIALPQPGDDEIRQLEPERQFQLDGELIRMRIGVVAKQMQLREAVVERSVRLREIKTKTPTDKPLLLTGDLLHVVQPTPNETHVVVTGSPAYAEAQELTISGGKLLLDRPAPDVNRFAVEGQGVLTMPVEQDLQGRPTAQPERLHLTWQGGMSHDGKTALFQRGVEARMSTQHLRTDRLQVLFADKTQVGAPQALATPGGAQSAQQIVQVDCFDGVQIDSRTTKPDGNPLAVERVAARTLSINQRTGDFVAEGPGEVTSLRLGTPGGANFPGQQPANPATAGGAPETKINYLNVTFQRQLVGNHPRKEMTFINQVRTLYGPVADWASTVDRNRPEAWSPETVSIDCEKMQVFARTDVAAATETFDLIAEGNTLVEGTTFHARAPRLTYAQTKDLLVIEGDGRTDAMLYHQKVKGGETSATSAKRFMVWPTTNRVQIDGATSLELTPR